MRNIALIISLTVTLTACGLKGPLYMPKAENQPNTPTTETKKTTAVEPKAQESIEQR